VKIIFDFISAFLTSAVIAILSPLVLFFRKRIFDYLKVKSKKWYESFLQSVAKKEKYKDLATISYLTLVIICGYVFISFSKMEEDFDRIEREYLKFKTLNDSVYFRMEQSRLRGNSYDNEIKDIQRITSPQIIARDSLDIVAKTLKEKREIDKLNNIVLLTNGVLKVVKLAIWSFLIYVTLLFSLTIERIRLINDFEWKLLKNRKVLTDKDVLDLEVAWANMTTAEDHKLIMSKLL